MSLSADTFALDAEKAQTVQPLDVLVVGPYLIYASTRLRGRL